MPITENSNCGGRFPHTFILDTGAEVSIVPRDFLATTNAVNQTVTSHIVKAFGRGDVIIEGPYYLNTEICGVRFCGRI